MNPKILALDFDGVLLNGLKEYFQTAWRAYCQIWSEQLERPPEGIANRFYQLRPVIETGWEMPLLVKALLSGESDEEIVADWPQVLEEIVTREGCDRSQAAAIVDRVRDEWIASDLEGWLDIQGFYPGTLEQLAVWMGSDLELFIVSTKEGRFIHELLERAGVDFPRDRILGKEVRRPKYATLRLLLRELGDLSSSEVWFVEDRLKALELVENQPDLSGVQLFLADWGYNLERDRQVARDSDRVRVLRLEQFCSSLKEWTDYYNSQA